VQAKIVCSKHWRRTGSMPSARVDRVVAVVEREAGRFRQGSIDKLTVPDEYPPTRVLPVDCVSL